MTRQAIVAALMAATMGLGAVAVTDTARADGIFSDMNPFNWFFGRDRDDYYWDRAYGPYGPVGPYAWGGPYGWGGPWGHAGYGAPQTVVVIPGEKTDESTKVAAVRLPE